tara:strand:+ start:959 stop:2380 length:1422 start_codon:yes stop_codon:yes gene_type:complete
MNIKYHKWDKNERFKLFKSCKEILELSECQFYQPYYSLYFNIHNTKKSHKTIDINRRFFIKEINYIEKERYETSNTILKCSVYDKHHNSVIEKDIFCKCIPILDPLYFLMNNYNNLIKRNPLLPSNYSYNSYNKINDMNNSAYIDTFFSFITSELTLNNINPSFPIFYGSVSGIKKEMKYDITEDYEDYKGEKWFYKTLGKTHTLDMYISSDDSDDEIDDNTSEDSYGDDNEYISLLQNMPCQNFFIEKLDGTLEDLLDKMENTNTDLILSCIFQISFALNYLQKHYNFTHNDLHVNNVMYTKTEKTFLYYKFNNIYFKVPTYGYIFKIIDFGRSIFDFHNKTFFNDNFSKHGEAEGQYTYPVNNLLFKKKELNIYPSFHFDMCRLATTIIDVCEIEFDKDYKEKQPFVDFIINLTMDINGESLSKLKDDFNMYVSISKYANNSLPRDIIQNYIFKNMRIKKKNFPKKLYYSL